MRNLDNNTKSKREINLDKSRKINDYVKGKLIEYSNKETEIELSNETKELKTVAIRPDIKKSVSTSAEILGITEQECINILLNVSSKIIND